jgi:putative DNA methylase
MSRGANFRCVISGAAISPDYIKAIGKSVGLGKTLIGVIAKGVKGKAYLEPDDCQIDAALSAVPDSSPHLTLPKHPQYNGVSGYGMETFGDLFTPRQLVCLNTFGDLVKEIVKIAATDFINNSQKTGQNNLVETESDARAYGIVISTYLAFAIDKIADRNSTLVNWAHNRQHASNTFKRQALSMTWDFSEINPFSESSGNFAGGVKSIHLALEQLFFPASGKIDQIDAQNADYEGKIISTDPPYYDNVPYADISDYFYVWMRKSIGEFYPSLFGTVGVPKMEELVADRVRHSGKAEADTFFLEGMTAALSNMRQNSSDVGPAAIYYAFKQSEISKDGVSSAGWVSFIEAVLRAGYTIVGTWPVRTELARRVRGLGSNALSNSVVLVCRKKELTADTVTRAEFIRALKRELPPAILDLQAANIAPADMPQSAIGPGMGVFSRYEAVLESDDSKMTVKSALQLINQELDEFLNDVQGEFDADTRFTITWYEQNGIKPGEYGLADNLARARGIAVESVKHAGIVESSAGKVRILKRDELLDAWDPLTDSHLTIWECLQYLVREHEENGISYDAAVLLKKMEDKAEAIKDLAYCLYDICANKRQDAKEATGYNALIADWAELTRQAAQIHDTSGERQSALDL